MKNHSLYLTIKKISINKLNNKLKEQHFLTKITQKYCIIYKKNFCDGRVNFFKNTNKIPNF